MKPRITLMGVLAAAYLLALGVLTGVAIDRMLYDRHRAEVPQRYEQALRQRHTYRMTLEKEATSQQ